MQDPTQVVYVGFLYLGIQNFEGFVLSLLVQQKAISLPLVLVVTSSQLLLGVLFGFLGVLLALPIVAVAFVLVKMIMSKIFSAIKSKSKVKIKSKKIIPSSPDT